MRRAALALAVLAALMGASGVGLGAAAAHKGGGGLGETAALFLILHAAALIGLAALAAQIARDAVRRALLGAGWGLGLAASLFGADLASRAFAGARLFPFAAPIGGTAMIVFWLAAAAVLAYGASRPDL